MPTAYTTYEDFDDEMMDEMTLPSLTGHLTFGEDPALESLLDELDYFA